MFLSATREPAGQTSANLSWHCARLLIDTRQVVTSTLMIGVAENAVLVDPWPIATHIAAVVIADWVFGAVVACGARGFGVRDRG